jgi:hypothetical protein
VRQAIATTHATWLLDASLFEAPATAEERANALRAARMMGYTLFRAATRMTHAPDGSAQLTVRIENRGAAPFYYVWPAELEALDVSGKVVVRARADWPLPSLLPGRKAEWSAELRAAPETIRTVLLEIANPMPGGRPVAFANAEMGTAQNGWLTLQ